MFHGRKGVSKATSWMAQKFFKIDEAKLWVHAVAVVGVALVGGLFVPPTVVASLMVLAVSSAIVWGVDKLTDFETKLVEAVVNEFCD